MTPRFAILCALSFALFACGGAAADGGGDTTAASPDAARRILIHRPFTAGQRVRIEVEGRQLIEAEGTTETSEAVVLDGFTETTEVSLAATVSIVEVDEHGRAARAEVVVERFVQMSTDEEILPAGTNAVAGWQGDTLVVEVDGQPLSEGAMKLLALAFPLERPGSALGDALFGSAEPREQGDTWDIHRDVVAQDLGEDGYEVTEEAHLNGQTSFVTTTECEGRECIVLEAAVTAESVTIEEQWEAVVFSAGQLEVGVRLLLPTDESLPVYSEEASTIGRFTIEASDGDTARELIASITRIRNATYTLLPAE